MAQNACVQNISQQDKLKDIQSKSGLLDRQSDTNSSMGRVTPSNSKNKHTYCVTDPARRYTTSVTVPLWPFEVNNHTDQTLDTHHCQQAQRVSVFTQRNIKSVHLLMIHSLRAGRTFPLCHKAHFRSAILKAR